MFFDFTFRKISFFSIIIFLIIAGIFITSSLDDKWNISEAFNLRIRSLRESLSYSWSHKLFGGIGAFDYRDDGKLAKSIPVLAYHGIPDEGSGDNPFSSINFTDHMLALKKAGWNTVTLAEFHAFIRGEIKLRERSFLLTFDDGRKDSFYPSDPLLKDLGYKAVMFAITKRSLSPNNEQSPYYLSEYELREMEKSGRWQVESHGRDSHDWYYIDENARIGHFFSNLLWLNGEGRSETVQ